ncbi:MAG: PASTA domain-containing protein [Clostridia bacterium]|nr:PASTA domain-containing protein [Clostridia bacterium]
MLNTERLCLGCMNDNGGEKICSICGFDSSESNDSEYLKLGYWIKERYLVGRVIEHNGEGVTYIGWDNKEDSIVNIREYYPKGAANRNEDGTVAIAVGNEFTFNEGIMSFLELNRKIATLSHLPSLLPTVEVFEECGTAYNITKAVPGITLREFLIRNGGDLTWEQARPLFLPLITTIAGLHEAGIVHRGISPETIFVGRDGKLRIIDICIRSVRMSNSNMAIQLFPGFSAVEQYGYDVQYRDGKYTDVYGMAATFFSVLMGKAPTDVTERISNDNMQIPARFAEVLPKYVLAALANGLQLLPADRIQDMDTFRIALTPVSGDATVAFTPVATPETPKSAPKSVAAPTPKPAPAPAAKPAAKPAEKPPRNYAVLSSLITAIIFIIIGVVLYFGFGIGQTEKPVDNSKPTSTVAPPSESTPANTGNSNEKLYQVPNLVGKRYADVIGNTDYITLFGFEIVSKQYSDKHPRGYIISQEQTSDQTVKKGTTIKIVVSLGPKAVKIPASIIGKSYDEAVIELLKLGFNYNCIEKLEVYDETKKPGVVVDVEPGVDTGVDLDAGIILRVNTYTGESQTPPDSAQ